MMVIISESRPDAYSRKNIPKRDERMRAFTIQSNVQSSAILHNNSETLRLAYARKTKKHKIWSFFSTFTFHIFQQSKREHQLVDMTINYANGTNG